MLDVIKGGRVLSSQSMSELMDGTEGSSSGPNPGRGLSSDSIGAACRLAILSSSSDNEDDEDDNGRCPSSAEEQDNDDGNDNNVFCGRTFVACCTFSPILPLRTGTPGQDSGLVLNPA